MQQRVESSAVRWFLYIGFAVCSVLLVAALTFGGNWRASLAGSLLYGVPALIVYLRNEQAVADAAPPAAAQQRGGTRVFDDVLGDPTKPPQR